MKLGWVCPHCGTSGVSGSSVSPHDTPHGTSCRPSGQVSEREAGRRGGRASEKAGARDLAMDATPKSFWSYQASEAAPSLEEAIKASAISASTTQAQWEALSPGMRREIARSAKKRNDAHDGGPGSGPQPGGGQKWWGHVRAGGKEVAKHGPHSSPEETKAAGMKTLESHPYSRHNGISVGHGEFGGHGNIQFHKQAYKDDDTEDEYRNEAFEAGELARGRWGGRASDKAGARDNYATDPPVSEAQRKAMFAAKSGNSTIGIPQKVGAEFAKADPGGKLPE
jgi:hypothetical protein